MKHILPNYQSSGCKRENLLLPVVEVFNGGCIQLTNIIFNTHHTRTFFVNVTKDRSRPIKRQEMISYFFSPVQSTRILVGTRTYLVSVCQGVGVSMPVVARMTSHKLIEQARET